MGSSDSIDWCGLKATQTSHSNFAFMAFVKADLLCFVLQWLMLFTNVSFVNATLKYSKCVNYCNLWCKPQELPCPETSRLNRLHQQLINKHVASLEKNGGLALQFLSCYSRICCIWVPASFPACSKSDSGIPYWLIFTVAITNVAVCSTWLSVLYPYV